MKLFFTAAYMILILHVSAQVNITGQVTDQRKNPLAGASITLQNTYDGATSDSLGNFNILTTEKGNQVIEVSLSGYSTYVKNITLDRNVVLNVSIKEMITELKAVILSAGSFEASDQKRATVLNSIDIVTTASANADITGAIKTLPGAQQVGEEGGLFVRGGTANESKTFIDGTLVNNFYYSSEPGLAQRGRFNPFLFKGTVFSAGGYSALYGQALSAALILESIDLPETSSGQVALSYLSAGGGMQHLSKNKRSSWGVSYSYTDLNLAYKLVSQKPDYFKVPVLHNADANFRIKTKGGIIKYYGMFGSTNTGFRYNDIDSLSMKNSFELDNINIYHNISWKENIGKGYKLITGFSYSNNKDDIKAAFLNNSNEKIVVNNSPLYANKNFSLIAKGRYLNVKSVIEKKLGGLSAFRGGVEYNYSNDKNVFTSYDGSIGKDTIIENLFSVFAEADIYLTNKLAAKIGARTEHSSLLDKWNVGPRISLAMQLWNKSQLSFAYGIFYQTPDKRYLPAAGKLGFSKATHYILQYQKLGNRRTFRTELFYKDYTDLYKINPNYGRQQASDNNGYGYAKGIEFFWRDKKTVKNVDYWLSYSFVDTKRDYLHYPASIKPPFAASHTASVVVKKFITGLKSMFNASYTFATGRPYYNISYNPNDNKYDIGDHGKTKPFNSLSFSVNYLPNIAKKGAGKYTVFVFSVTNVLGSNNVYGYNYSFNGMNKQPVLPPSKRFFFLGCFISFGIDRTDDVINNSL